MIKTKIVRADVPKLSTEDKLAYAWMLNSNKTIIFGDQYYHNLSELNQDWDQFNGMDVIDQMESDQISMTIYNEANAPRYERIRNSLFEKLDKESKKIRSVLHKPDSEYTKDPFNLIMLMREAENPKADLKAFNETTANKEYIKKVQQEANIGESENLIYPIYTPMEMKSIGTSYNSTIPRFSRKPSIHSLKSRNKIDVSKWYNEYTNLFYGGNLTKYKDMMYDYVDTISSLKEEYDETVDLDTKASIAQSLVDLGWNPVANVSDANLEKSRLRIKNFINSIIKDIHIYSLVGIQDYMDIEIEDDDYNLNIESDSEYSYLYLAAFKESGEYINFVIFPDTSGPFAKVTKFKNIPSITTDLHSTISISRLPHPDETTVYDDTEADIFAIRMHKKYGPIIRNIFNSAKTLDDGYIIGARPDERDSIDIENRVSLKLFIHAILVGLNIESTEKYTHVVYLFDGTINDFIMSDSNKKLLYLDKGFKEL